MQEITMRYQFKTTTIAATTYFLPMMLQGTVNPFRKKISKYNYQFKK